MSVLGLAAEGHGALRFRQADVRESGAEEFERTRELTAVFPQGGGPEFDAVADQVVGRVVAAEVVEVLEGPFGGARAVRRRDQLFNPIALHHAMARSEEHTSEL